MTCLSIANVIGLNLVKTAMGNTVFCSMWGKKEKKDLLLQP